MRSKISEDLMALNIALQEHLTGDSPLNDAELVLLRNQSVLLCSRIDEAEAHLLSYRYFDHPHAQIWKSILEKGQYVEAIKAAREAHDLGIRDAKDLIDAYRDRKYAFTALASS